MSGTGATIYELKFHNRTFGHASGVDGTLLRMTAATLAANCHRHQIVLWALLFFNQDLFVGGDDTVAERHTEQRLDPPHDRRRKDVADRRYDDGRMFLEDFQSKIGGGYWVAASNLAQSGD